MRKWLVAALTALVVGVVGLTLPGAPSFGGVGNTYTDSGEGARIDVP
jgi:hypothetical protein